MKNPKWGGDGERRLPPGRCLQEPPYSVEEDLTPLCTAAPRGGWRAYDLFQAWAHDVSTSRIVRK